MQCSLSPDTLLPTDLHQSQKHLLRVCFVPGSALGPQNEETRSVSQGVHSALTERGWRWRGGRLLRGWGVSARRSPPERGEDRCTAAVSRPLMGL